MKQKSMVLLILIALIIFSSLIFFSCPKGKSNEVEVFTWWTAGGEADGLAAMQKIFEEKYPGIKFINAAVAGGAGTNAKAVLKTRMQGGDPPDSFQVHAGHELIDTWVVAGKMEPITFIFKDNKYLDKYPKGLVDIISYKGEIYSVPVNIHRSNVLWYNKKVFSDNNISVPNSLEEFFKVAEVLKGKGIIPLALAESWTNSHMFESILLGSLGDDKYKGLWDGSTAWDSTEVKRAIQNFVDILDYVNSDFSALSWEQAAQYVIDGKAAMYIMGDWAEGYFKSKGLTPNKEFGWAPAPGTKGVFMMLSDSFCLPKGAPNRKNAIKWLEVCASKEGQDAFNPIKGSIPSRTDGDKALYDEYLKSAMDDFSSNTIVPSVMHGAAASEGWMEDYNNIVTILVTEKAVDKAVGEFVKAAKKNLK